MAGPGQIQRRKLSGEVLDRLMERLAAGEFPAGGQLPSERDLMEEYGVGRPAIREALQSQNIESRPIWKPMHQQPVFRDNEAHLTGVSDRLFEEGLCLPSGVGLSDGDIERVGAGVKVALA